jgi:SPP1 gp7 family putative phage head morphogenesis protein
MARPRSERRIGQPPPRGLEGELVRALRGMAAQVRATLPKIKTAADVRALGRALTRAWSDDRIRKIVDKVGAKAEAAGSRPWTKYRRPRPKRDRADAAEYDGEALLEKWSREATARITSVRDEVAERMRDDVLAAIELGIDAQELAEGWRRQGIPVKFGTLEGRTKVIAQNQLAILHAQVQAQRAEALGVEEFIWRTMLDDAVRHEHFVLEGTRHTYKRPPPIGLPGTPINCRCYAESVLPPELLIEIEGVVEP